MFSQKSPSRKMLKMISLFGVFYGKRGALKVDALGWNVLMQQAEVQHMAY